MLSFLAMRQSLLVGTLIILSSPSKGWGFYMLSLPSINTDGRRVRSLSDNRIVFERSSHKHRTTVECNMKNNNSPNYLAPDFYAKKNEKESEIDTTGEEGGEEEPKRGIFRRIKDRVSATFGSKVADETEGNQKEGSGNGYKPNPLDGLRLRLAMAMSGLSNMDILNRRNEWVVACSKTRVGPGQITPCVVNGLDIIIFASRDGKRLDAFANSCPHLGSPFDLATIERKPATERGQRIDDGVGDGCVDCIVCPVHRTAFEIQSGDVRGEWCPYPPVIGKVMGFTKPKSKLVKFAVRLKGKNVEVRIATSVKNVRNKEEQAEGMSNIK
jgi:nitrite reductase/ring-hydroxylating ferredoxin subunit